jgi:hypothetical protein
VIIVSPSTYICLLYVAAYFREMSSSCCHIPYLYIYGLCSTLVLDCSFTIEVSVLCETFFHLNMYGFNTLLLLLVMVICHADRLPT